MDKAYIEEQKFEGIDFKERGIRVAEYEVCRFINCNFSNADLSGIGFSECEFRNCDLSNVKTIQTRFREVRCIETKLLGILFENCDDFLFSIYFESCTLNFSSFYKRNLKKFIFKSCSLREVDFAFANLSNAIFENCDLSGSKFENTILENADLRSAAGYSIDPELNVVRKTKFSLSGLPGLLDKYDIEISNE